MLEERFEYLLVAYTPILPVIHLDLTYFLTQFLKFRIIDDIYQSITMSNVHLFVIIKTIH
jgi:hypothetical protein